MKSALLATSREMETSVGRRFAQLKVSLFFSNLAACPRYQCCVHCIFPEELPAVAWSDLFGRCVSSLWGKFLLRPLKKTLGRNSCLH